MSAGVRFLAVDLGASSGRVMACTWDGQRFSLDELHRIPNDGVPMAGELTWNAPGLWKGILDGMSSYRARFNDSPCSVAVDAWGVDFALLDKCGRLVSNPTHYRDTRTLGTPQKVFDKVPEREWFAETGTQTMAINTLFQLCSMVFKDDPRLNVADKLVMIPDLFLHFLCGESGVEFTEATTSHMYSFRSSNWAGNLLERVGVPTGLLPRVVSPGTRLAVVRPDVLRACDLERSSFPAIAVASHDTAAAVASIPEMDEGSVFICSGTWSLVGVQAPCPDTSEYAMRLGFTNDGAADGGALLLKNVTGLWILQECLKTWRLSGQSFGWDAMVEAAEAAPAHASCFDSNRPEFQVQADMPNAIRAYCRATNQPVPESKGEIARCALESLALKYCSTVEQLALLTGRRFDAIRIVGGGCLNRLLCQMTADATKLMVVVGPVEASTFGNAMMQAIATGQLASIPSGKDAVAASIERQLYYPQASGAWDDAFVRFKQIELTNQVCV